MLKYAVTLFAIVFGSLAVADERPGIDPRALEIVAESSDFLSSRAGASVGWLITYDKIVDGRKKHTEVWTGSSVLVRGVGYKSTSSQGIRSQQNAYNGSNFSVAYADTQEYATVEIEGSFREMVDTLRDDYAFSIPMADVFDPSGADGALEQLTEAEYLGEVLFGDQVVHHVAFRRYEGDWQIWISTDSERPVPLMIVGTDPYSLGWPQFQALLYDWSFDLEMSASEFEFPKPQGYSNIQLQSVEGSGVGEGQ